MKNSRLTIAAVMLMLGAVVTTAPLAAQKSKPDNDTMMGSGGMGGQDMMGMMNMMEQMNKMMGLCNKMMETAMKDTDGSKPQTPMDSQKAPERKN